ncbi:Arabinogalactan peptide 22 [Striga hermonthica]|uniref:Arabinogalactan peptide 22 n=1 Tax=Striga hermonthica TaxID=68872 RepID=A0A9N7R0U9_STRHE|nr:Arabinogalactan peptide 22 [Striga hermonthica]
MEMLQIRLYYCVMMVMFGLVLGFILPSINGQMTAGAAGPAPAPASSDGVAIDQGIAYVLMLLALALTYIIH